MKDKQVKTEYNYLVLTDFSEASYSALKYAISLAKLIKGNIHVCHIANPSKIVQNDNQVAAIRDITTETKKIEKKIGAIVEMIMAEGINAIPYCSIGNIIYDFEELVTQLKPDVVILGKKPENPKLSGKITSYLINEYLGSLLIVKEDDVFQNSTKISVACNNNTFDLYDPKLIFSLNNQTKLPLRLLNIKQKNGSFEEITVPQTWRESSYEIDQNIQLEQHATIVDSIVQQITNNDTELLCIGRGKSRNYLQRMFSSRPSTLLDLVNKIHTPILVMGTNS
ncbi:MAG: universal stress protein [Flavobacteriales bacterium]|tara:strand:- start:3267 stop:4109 length:843 start_codon:yes stop_codon:yes gene_type:complete